VFEENRKSIKNDIQEEIDFISDQTRKIVHPPPQKPYPEDALLINLIPPGDFKTGKISLLDVINKRRSRRVFSKKYLSLEELSFLLWSTQGVREVIRGGATFLRTVPSAGARHPFETYLVVNHVKSLEKGVYRYLSLEHKLYFLYNDKNLMENLNQGCYGKKFVKNSAVTFVWTAIPYRTEWRYGPLAHKFILLDIGHVCQNLYLASEAIGAGTCAIATYHQKKMDELLMVDGEDEFTIYLSPLGKIKEE
jgi:SagB-type dehydrogenase family enzyme